MALLSSKTPGSIVKIKENGSFVNYIVLIHGYPVSNGTLIWRQSLTSVSKAVEKYTYDGSSADIYLTGVFYSSLDPYIQENIINRAGIEYVQCEITAEPHMAGYHVRPYAYVVYDTEKDSSYIPIEGLFSQEEYVADQEGTCTIWYENTMAELQKKLEDIAAEKRRESSKAIIRVDCAVAIQYIESKERQTDLYELRSGELIPIGEEETIRIKGIWEAEDSVKIDMLSWPALDIKMLDKIIT